MTDLIAKCGCDCGRCPSFRGNLVTAEDRENCSTGWEKYLDFRLSPDRLKACPGCQYEGDDALRYQSCYVRECALYNGVRTCAACTSYPCEDVPRVSLDSGYRKRLEEKSGNPIVDKDYDTFIECYEGIGNLERIRSELSSGDTVRMKTVSFRPCMTPFPDSMERMDMKELHEVLRSLAAAEHVSFARRYQLRKSRQRAIRILWAFGVSGRLDADGNLVIDALDLLSAGVSSSKHRLKTDICILGRSGVVCEFIPIEEGGWLTPAGALRKRGWKMTLRFDTAAGGTPVIHALTEYSQILTETAGKDAFRCFSRGDMTMLANES